MGTYICLLLCVHLICVCASDFRSFWYRVSLSIFNYCETKLARKSLAVKSYLNKSPWMNDILLEKLKTYCLLKTLFLFKFFNWLFLIIFSHYPLSPLYPLPPPPPPPPCNHHFYVHDYESFFLFARSPHPLIHPQGCRPPISGCLYVIVTALIELSLLNGRLF